MANGQAGRGVAPLRDQEQLDDSVVAALEKFSRTAKALTLAEADNSRLEAINAELIRNVDFLGAQLKEAERKRDFYHASYIALHTQLDVASGSILRALQMAGLEAAAEGIDSPKRRGETVEEHEARVNASKRDHVEDPLDEGLKNIVANYGQGQVSHE